MYSNPLKTCTCTLNLCTVIIISCWTFCCASTNVTQGCAQLLQGAKKAPKNSIQVLFFLSGLRKQVISSYIPMVEHSLVIISDCQMLYCTGLSQLSLRVYTRVTIPRVNKLVIEPTKKLSKSPMCSPHSLLLIKKAPYNSFGGSPLSPPIN